MLIITVSMVSVLHAKTFKTAIEYNDFLVNEQRAIVAKINKVYAFMDVNTFDAKLAGEAQKELAIQCNQSIKDVTNADAFENDDDFKSSTLSLFDCYKNYADSGLVEMIGIWANSNRTQLDVDRYNDIVSSFNLLEGLYFTFFEFAQEDFAAANNFTLAKNK